MKNGRPKTITVEKIQLACTLRERGFSLDDIAEALKIDRTTFYVKGSDWNKLKEQLNLIKEKKELEQIEKVQAALYQRAVGQKLKTKKEIFDADGTLTGYTVETKQIQGDFKAQQFYLINRDPENWSATPEETTPDGADDKIIIEIKDK